MNVRLSKRIRRGETLYGTLTRETNGICCFDETVQLWQRPAGTRRVLLRTFPNGTRVSRKGTVVRIQLDLPMTYFDDVLDVIDMGNEMTDALLYVERYQERRRT